MPAWSDQDLVPNFEVFDNLFIMLCIVQVSLDLASVFWIVDRIGVILKQQAGEVCLAGRWSAHFGRMDPTGPGGSGKHC